MADQRVSRRQFVSRVGGAIGAAAFGKFASARKTHAAPAGRTPQSKVPETPFVVGHMTFLSGPGAVLAAPMRNGHVLAAEEINANGGLLGRRRIVTITADESAGIQANVNELRRMKREAKINAFTGIASSQSTSALGPIAEELKTPTLFVDGGTDALFESIIPNPRYVFRVNNLQSADGAACAVAVAKTWPDVRRIAFLNLDYGYARSVFEHFHVAIKKLLPGASILAEIFAPFGASNFASIIRRADTLKPDLIVSGLWGADYRTFYQQALSAGLFGRMRVATTAAFGVAPHTIGLDHPEAVMAGMRASYYWTLPAQGGWPANGRFVQRYLSRWNEYPNFEAEGAYTALHLLRIAIERANQVTGGWPDDEAIVRHLEGLSWDSPAGPIVIRADNHQGYRDAVVGFSHHDARYPFTVVDRIIRIPIRDITAPPGWPVGPPTSSYRWIEKTWPVAK
jgi:branched-chain amino acid transport system substrate-binding protein